MSERFRLYFLATLADEAQMHDDAAMFMKSLVFSGVQLNYQEFTLLCRSIQMNTNKMRFSWKAVKERIVFYQDNNVNGRYDQQLQVATDYLQQIGDEIIDFCFDNIETLDQCVSSNAGNYTILVLALRKIADNYRYLAEIAKGEEKRALSTKADEFYREALDQSLIRLPPSNPARLRVFLNYSLFLYKILHQRLMAIELTKRAFNEAFTDFPNIGQVELDEVDGIMQTLRGNLDIWARHHPTRNGYHHKDVGQGDGIHVG